MSKSKLIYVGCYVEIPKQFKTVTKTVTTCNNNHTERAYGAKYCNKCGLPLFSKTVTTEEPFNDIDYDYIFEPNEDVVMVFDNDKHNVCLAPNNHIGNVYGDVSVCLNISPEYILQQQEMFKDLFEEELSILEDRFGKLRIKFGMLTKMI